jgi:shikimate kinase
VTMWLVGMMGVGKTSIGERAAAAVGAPFYDTDRMVVEMAGRAIAEIWADQGERAFRDLERRAVAAVPVTSCLAAAGGGAVLERSNREQMQLGAPVIWLDSDPALLAARVGGDVTRPLVGDLTSSGETLQAILEHRRPLYAEVSTHVIETGDRPLDELVGEVVALWPD